MGQYNANSQTSTYKTYRDNNPGVQSMPNSQKIKRLQSKASKKSIAGSSARNIGELTAPQPRPASAQFGKYRGRNYKDDDHINREHLLNLKSQYKKISEMGYNQDYKKKKPYDPVANPALVFKRKKPKGVITDGQSGIIGKKNVYYQNQPDQRNEQKFKSQSKQKPKITRSAANMNKPRIYRTEYGDFTEDQLREILRWQEAEKERIKQQKIVKRPVTAPSKPKKKVAKQSNKKEVHDVPLNHQEFEKEKEHAKNSNWKQELNSMKAQYQNEGDDNQENIEIMRPRLKKRPTKKVAKKNVKKKDVGEYTGSSLKNQSEKQGIEMPLQKNKSLKQMEEKTSNLKRNKSAKQNQNPVYVQQDGIIYQQGPDGKFYALDSKYQPNMQQQTKKTAKKKPANKASKPIKKAKKNEEGPDSVINNDENGEKQEIIEEQVEFDYDEDNVDSSNKKKIMNNEMANPTKQENKMHENQYQNLHSDEEEENRQNGIKNEFSNQVESLLINNNNSNNNNNIDNNNIDSNNIDNNNNQYESSGDEAPNYTAKKAGGKTGKQHDNPQHNESEKNGQQNYEKEIEIIEGGVMQADEEEEDFGQEEFQEVEQERKLLEQQMLANKEKKAQISNNRPYSGRRHSEPEKAYVDYVNEDQDVEENLVCHGMPQLTKEEMEIYARAPRTFGRARTLVLQMVG